jgi:hypothetical protein
MRSSRATSAGLTILLAFSIGVCSINADQEMHAMKLTGGMNLGYSGGAGVQTTLSASDIAVSLPVSLSLGLGYTSLNPGKSADARRIFINNATNGTPEKSGRIWDFRLDVRVPTGFSSLPNSYWYAGPRYSMFTGNFKYIGGNEDFDVTSKQSGLGCGFGNRFQVNQRFGLSASIGIDYFFNSTLRGHDTSYSPDGEYVNQREDYEFSDADNAINQPRFEPRVMVGVEYSF